MLKLRDALMILLKNTKKVQVFKDDQEYILKVAAYNEALSDIRQMILDYEDGKIGQDFIRSLDKEQRDNH